MSEGQPVRGLRDYADASVTARYGYYASVLRPGMSRDLGRAERLYRTAARDENGPQWVYVPSGRNSAGRVFQIDRAVRKPGLNEARRRLNRLRNRS